MPACSQENPRGSGHSKGAQPVGSRALPYWMSPTRALSLESASAAALARQAAMATASGAISALHMNPSRSVTGLPLLVEPRARRIVGTVNVGVATQAGASDQALVRRLSGCQPRDRLQVVRVQRHGVALLAQHRHGQHQQRLLVGAV